MNNNGYWGDFDSMADEQRAYDEWMNNQEQEPEVVPCPKCLTHFDCYLNEPSLEDNKNKIKVIDLASFIGELLFLV